MPAHQAVPIPPPTPAEMASLVARAGLTLNAGQMADLVLAWRYLAQQIAGISRDRPIRDDLPHAPPAAARPPARPASPARPLAGK